MVDKYLSTVRSSDNPAATRGFTIALGFLPAKLLAPSPAILDAVISTLSRVSRHDATVGNEKDAETRRNALVALRRVSQTVGIASTLGGKTEANSTHHRLDAKSVSVIFTTFFAGVEDYNVDRRRGDVGSWCRIEAMKGLETITFLVMEQASEEVRPELFAQDISQRLIGGLLKQLSEKLDRVRVEAGRCLQHLLFTPGLDLPFLEQKDQLKECFCLDRAGEGTKSINWADASVTFPMVAKAAQFDAYFPFIVAGMVISVGGLTESVTKQSTSVFLQLAKDAKGTKRISDLSIGKD